MTLWRTYTTLPDLKSVFRCLKSELGVRSVYHHKTDRVTGHLFISLLAYHVVHPPRVQLKACGIHPSWDGLRREHAGQDRITVESKRAASKRVHAHGVAPRTTPTDDLRRAENHRSPGENRPPSSSA